MCTRPGHTHPNRYAVGALPALRRRPAPSAGPPWRAACAAVGCCSCLTLGGDTTLPDLPRAARSGPGPGEPWLYRGGQTSDPRDLPQPALQRTDFTGCRCSSHEDGVAPRVTQLHTSTRGRGGSPTDLHRGSERRRRRIPPPVHRPPVPQLPSEPQPSRMSASTAISPRPPSMGTSPASYAIITAQPLPHRTPCQTFPETRVLRYCRVRCGPRPLSSPDLSVVRVPMRDVVRAVKL